MRRSKLNVIDTLRVATPCSADWDLMAGDDKQRFCKSCEKHVYNLPLLSPDELVDLIERTEGKFCGRLYERRDGTVLTGDCPVGLAAQLAATRRGRRRIGAAAVLAATAAAMMLAAGTLMMGRTMGDIRVPDHNIAAGGIPIEPEEMRPLGEMMIVPINEPSQEEEEPKVEETELEPPRKKLLGKIHVPTRR